MFIVFIGSGLVVRREKNEVNRLSLVLYAAYSVTP